ncbi:MAG TPA: DUF2723 domain-containing protein, partial [Fibrobacteria bacterium]|nr:DUF2723 domain-containing protein [Fibrobacteria bacterium]
MRNSFRAFFQANWPGLLVAVLALAVYLVTLSPFMTWEDSGELATAAATLGIPHPTGYPLFAMLGRIFSVLPLGDLRVIVKLNVMAALICTAAVYFYYRLFLLLLVDRTAFPSRKVASPLSVKGRKAGAVPSPKADSATGPRHARLAAALGAFSLAFSWTFWSEAVSLEVYALHLLMLSIVSLVFLRSLARPESQRLWIL